MDKEIFYKLLIPKERDIDKVSKIILNSPEMVPYLIEGVGNRNVRVRFGCFNVLVKISDLNPKIIYPHFDTFIGYLESENSVLKLGAIKIIANLSKVDSEDKFDEIFDKFYAFLSDPGMTSAANVCKGSVTIAKSKPYLAEKIIDQLLQVNKNIYKTDECKNILIGHVISSLSSLVEKTYKKEEIRNFVRMNEKNPWKGTKTKAEKFLKNYA